MRLELRMAVGCRNFETYSDDLKANNVSLHPPDWELLLTAKNHMKPVNGLDRLDSE